MRAQQFLWTLVLVIAGLAGYHVVFGAGARPATGDGTDEVEVRGATPGEAGLRGEGLRRTVEGMDERLAGLEQRVGDLLGRTPPPETSGAWTEAELDYWRGVLAEIRRRERLELEGRRFEQTVRRAAPEAADADVERAVTLVQKHYEWVRALYDKAPRPLDAETRKNLQAEVSAREQAVAGDLGAFLPEDAVRGIIRKLPGGLRSAGGTTDPRGD